MLEDKALGVRKKTKGVSCLLWWSSIIPEGIIQLAFLKTFTVKHRLPVKVVFNKMKYYSELGFVTK